MGRLVMHYTRQQPSSICRLAERVSVCTCSTFSSSDSVNDITLQMSYILLPKKVHFSSLATITLQRRSADVPSLSGLLKCIRYTDMPFATSPQQPSSTVPLACSSRESRASFGRATSISMCKEWLQRMERFPWRSILMDTKHQHHESTRTHLAIRSLKSNAA